MILHACVKQNRETEIHLIVIIWMPESYTESNWIEFYAWEVV